MPSNPARRSLSGQNQTASVENVVCGRVRGTISIVEPSAIALRWYATTCSVTATRPKCRSTPRRGSRRIFSSIAVSVSFFTCVYQSAVMGATSAVRASWSSRRTWYCSPRWR